MYVIPAKRVTTQDDMHLFTASQTKQDILQFIKDLSGAVVGCTNNEPCDTTPAIDAILESIGQVEQTVDRHMPEDQVSSRFGKPEFRDFYDDVMEHAKDWMTSILQAGGLKEWGDEPTKEKTAAAENGEAEKPKEQPNGQASQEEAAATAASAAVTAPVEIGRYFIESWGNRTRIDYGSGHELNFIAFLLCLERLGVVGKADYKALVIRVFKAYLATMRKIQTQYWLEPAGSHGVWGLDDYHFLPFLFGAAQLSTHKHLRPLSIHDKDIVEMYKDEYMYLGCIYFINSVKTTASLRWHSPMLDDISGVKKWSKVQEGLTKMYDAEVLGKLPIIQHFMFGGIIAAPEGVSPARLDEHEGGQDDDDDGHGHAHAHSTWADCCGIKVPSAIAARQMHESGKLRSIPFD